MFHVASLPERQSSNAVYYYSLVNEPETTDHPIKSVVFLHYYVHKHTASIARKKSKEMFWTPFENPSHNLGLSLCDYYTFLSLIEAVGY